MYKKTIFPALVILLLVGANATAIMHNWTAGGGADRSWTNADNWDQPTPPTLADETKLYYVSGPADGPLVNTSDANAFNVRVGGPGGGATWCTLSVVDGGVLNLAQWLMAGTDSGSVRSGALNMTGGTINCGTVSPINGHLFVAHSATGTQGFINMSGGTINVTGTFYIAYGAGTAGTVNLSGGTIYSNSFQMNPSGLGTASMDITGTGKLIIDGDETAAIIDYIGNGWLTGYGSEDNVLYDYDITTPGKTTVTGYLDTSQATNPSPNSGATKVPLDANLSWTAGDDAVSHDVYFGTISPGDFQQNQTETTFDPGVLDLNTTYYWQIDEVNEAHPNSPWIGDVWMFTTGSVVIATLPSPVDGASNVSINPTLSWTAGVTASSHDVYFGTDPTPDNQGGGKSEFQGNQTSTTFDPCTLAFDTTYYWRIDEVEDGTVYTGDVWSFSTQGPFEKSPYLIYPGDNTQMTVLWQMTTISSCTLEWGLDTSYSSGSTVTSEYGTDHQHEYTITSLTPSTKYYYRVTAGAAQSTGSFRTAPATDATSVKFLVYGDTRTNPDDHSAVCEGMISTFTSDPNYQTMLLHSGDWVETNSEKDWTDDYFNRSYSGLLQTQANLAIQGCMGNHEGAGTVYMKYWPYPYVADRYWSFDYGPAHIAIVDQYVNYAPGSAQLTWLENDLSTSTKQWKFIVLHEPGWSAGGSHGNDISVQNYIQPLCEQYGVQLVFSGHNHYYARADVNDVHHITTGGGGAPLYDGVPGQPYIVTYNKTHHYCKVNIIDANSLAFQAVKPDGTVIDAFYFDKREPDFTFIQTTDPQMEYCLDSPSNWWVTINKVNILNPAFLIVTGDLLNSPGSQYQADLYFDAAAGLKPGITRYDLAGNHDLHDAPTPTSYAWYQSQFGDPCAPPWYSFTYDGNNLFIALESCILKDATGYPGKDVEQMDWLTTTLTGASGYDNILVFMHHPLCVSSISEPNSTWNIPTARRSELLTLFHTYGVRAVFAGHYHRNAYVRDGELEIITTNSCTCPLAADPPGFRVVKVYPNHISHTYRTLDSIVTLAGDFNGDGTVDFKDVGILVERWLDSGMWPQFKLTRQF